MVKERNINTCIIFITVVCYRWLQTILIFFLQCFVNVVTLISFLTSLFWRRWWGGKDWEDIRSLPLYDKGLGQFSIIHQDTCATAGCFA